MTPSNSGSLPSGLADSTRAPASSPGLPEPAAAADPAPPPATPTAPAERIAILDVIRGVAILGIIGANLPSFAIPTAAEGHVHWISPHWSETAAVLFKKTFVDMKFVSIFSLLFGAGILLQRQRAEAKGRSFFPGYAWRLALLAAVGIAHAWLLWFGDILFWYALVGLGAMLLSGLGARALAAIGLAATALPAFGCAAFGLLLMLAGIDDGAAAGGWGGPSSATTAAAALAEPGATADGFAALFHPGHETLVYASGSYLDMATHRLLTWAFTGFSFALYFGWRIAGLFLLGMAMMRAGVFADPARHRRLLTGALVAGIAVGLPIEAAHGASWAFGPPGPGALLLLDAAHQVGSLLLALGYVAGLLLLRPHWRPIAAVGRTALSCYLLQTVIAVTIFYSFGLGLYGSLARTELWLLALAIGLLLPLAAVAWLRRFRMGPVEWAWRSLAYGARQPMRAPAAATTITP